ncbi:MAG: hypothetical protein SCALA702_08670 [Melioribacteraceae bacterium]|nr:MAG: hypothetical protein SCALA702_08670 [Melioribacteraceae bacterium]
MKKLKFYLLFLFVLTSAIQAQDKVYIGNINGEIDLGLVPYVKRVISEAEKNFADAVIFRINTFGGRVDAATQIKDAILNSEVTTIAFIDKRAISAGALISLSCQKIAMVPGASIGASTVVDQTGQKVSEKYQSYMRSEMRATAEKNGRRTDVAEAMVDETVVVEGLVDSTKLVTLTSAEAIIYGINDTTVATTSQLLEAFNLKDADIVELNENWAEGVVRWLNHPIISSLLIMIGMIGMFTEIKTPGWGLPGTAALVALAIYFGSGFLLDLVSVIEILLFVAGVVLLAIEIFAVPGFGVFGILGIVMMVSGIFLGLVGDFEYIDWNIISAAIIQLAVTIMLSIVVMVLLAKYLPRTRAFNAFILQDQLVTTSGYTSSKPTFGHLVNEKGTAYTDLRPAGTAIINGERVDVTTAGEYLKHGTNVMVKSVSGSRIVVEEIVNSGN